MRKQLNENPRVQLAVLGVVGVIFAFVLFTSVLSGDEEPAPPPGATDTTGAATPPPSDPATPPPATPDPVAPPPSSGGSVSGDGLVPSEGLPEGVLVALAKRKAVALLVIDPKGISDEQVKRYTVALGGRDDVAVFVVKAKDVADYARITAGVQVNRTPALVVVQPRDGDGDALAASVSYGFRGSKSVQVALEDALYTGETRSAGPG